MRKEKESPEENHERWLVSYADFVTLLFAFFVVLFASSTVDQAKVQSFATQFESYVNPGIQQRRGGLGSGGSTSGSAEAKLSEPSIATHEALTMVEMRPSIEQLERELFPEIQQGKLELSLQGRGLVMSLRESAFFAPGESELQPESMTILAKVAEALTRIPGRIRLEGHTDNVPIQTRKHPSNWHLSTARAIAVPKLLANRYNISPERLAVAGYGEFRPLRPNDTRANRAKNRRVDVVILTKDAAEMEPPQPAPVASE